MTHEPLHGSCSCGRNQYQIDLPDDVNNHAEVYFDSSRDNRQLHGTPLTAWLRVPLDWYQSHTQSFFPDETHSSIRRIFSPRHAPHTRRIFCGFCGTPLTYWTEDPREEANFMSIAIGSLLSEDQRALEDLHLLPEDFDDEASHADISTSALTPSLAKASSVIVPSFEETPDISRSFRRGTADGIPWFEEMVEGSRLGRLMRAKRGMGVSDDNSTSIEWEISEWHEDGTSGIAQEDSDSNSHHTGKRKRGHQAEAASRQKRA
ncbi:Glutathione-dependent formaldehyde-activating enzyme/centromere protein V [Penicillium hispanicum]|uniref:Glutathione-dependent formaldehyde-activating enzyme/centromere protein V n=1 Tax=Penicillium hispanicum TaxID=1080232 RepID=UPI002542144F|nr:Glutathione-dependent formaldehyde-activating enzyme/centromere protein V [Penicillium hispanicum]KAJ5578584.1 Glutathione-dependent formaldehyde-activating enzyme/centromere protein V [Penicillium hispanicum]